MKLKYKEIAPLRAKLLIEQDHCCRLCGDPIDSEEAVLDHDHRSGLLRGVLHRGCNSLLGKIENSMPRSRVDLGRLSQIADNLILYLTADPVSDQLHPTHKEPMMGKGRGRGRGGRPPKR